jgi:hypothetical protein
MIKDYTWSYKKESVPLQVKIEYLFKYGDTDEINEAIREVGSDYCKKIWIEKIIPDERFHKLSYFLARFIFNISTDRKEILDFLKQHQRKRFDGAIPTSSGKE